MKILQEGNHKNNLRRCFTLNHGGVSTKNIPNNNHTRWSRDGWGQGSRIPGGWKAAAVAPNIVTDPIQHETQGVTGQTQMIPIFKSVYHLGMEVAHPPCLSNCRQLQSSINNVHLGKTCAPSVARPLF